MFAAIGAYSFIDIIKVAIIIAGCLGVLFVVLRVMGIPIPPWVWHIVLIVICVFLGIVAINFMASM